ncbi:uncharacterized protein EI90DRAFT_3157068 [Cantharellus anzutake]|uniref:uncharacterized protein n=1 Tax=Cantharellus anzutake TaxID=1750568 RepID=UPI0019045437|nr:uncharacterized protein EI90DRAFT_3157068 [Cantharellus anzutake]KAF8325223.1 hypothetical protein EI90DRAFT_3157068 [Cantharellus anzutake]
MADKLKHLHFEHNLPGVEPWRPPFKLPESGNFDSLLNDAYLLHLLAIRPERVLPPGKSIASVFSDAPREGTPRDTTSLEQQVAHMVTRAFWEEAISSLSSQYSGTIISRLSQLYRDMHAVLLPVLPSTLPIMMTLSRPLSPSSSPLMSGINVTRVVLHELRERCAPARDPEIDSLLRKINNPVSEREFPNLLVSTIRSIFQIIEEMTSDLHHFRLSSLGESDMRQLVRAEAQRRERELVLRLYGGSLGVSRPFREWVSFPTTTSEPLRWIARLISSLSTPISISVHDPPFTEMPPEAGALAPSPEQPTNILPPVFLLSSPLLFRIQNLLQALVACACLRVFAFPSTSSQAQQRNHAAHSQKAQGPSETTFVSRVWTLLNTEIDRGGYAEAETKLVNLEDEVIHVARFRQLNDGASSGPQNLSTSEEDRIRNNVRRIIRAEDPVFKLFMKRVADAIDQYIVSLREPASQSGAKHSMVPLRLRTGRHVGKAQDNSYKAPLLDQTIPLPIVKGFEDHALVEGLGEITKEILDCIVWVEEVWQDALASGLFSPTNH